MQTSDPAAAPPIGHRLILGIAGPIVLSNASTPLVGLVDIWVIGRIPDAAYIGAIAVGSTIFNFVFWGFGFLRMGTTGLTAQAVAGIALIALQLPIAWIAFRLIGAAPPVEALARQFFAIRIWSAPLTLANYALLGWFIGRRRAGLALALQVFMNLTNLLLNVTFVLGLGWAVRGVAAGTVIAESAACLLGLGLAQRDLMRIGGRWSPGRLIDANLARTIQVNRDIMLRTLCVIFALAFFTSQGARAGTVALAANAVLFQFVMVATFLLDGFAFAAEALIGQAIGMGSRGRFDATLRLVTTWSAGSALLLSAVIWLAGPSLIFASDPAVRAAARHFLPWAALSPVVSVWCFVLDGVFIGATRTRVIRDAMFVSLAIFLGAWWYLAGAYGNDGLWAALMVFFMARAVTLGLGLPALARGLGPALLA